MREQASQVEIAARTKTCPKCSGTGNLMSPLKEVQTKDAVYHCRACSFVFWHNGNQFIADSKALHDIFRGATLGNAALKEMASNSKMNPATEALFTAKIMEYGLQMWFDGLKQGLLLGAASNER
jgi:hypothetical protein